MTMKIPEIGKKAVQNFRRKEGEEDKEVQILRVCERERKKRQNHKINK